MSSHLERIEIYPDYNKDGSIDIKAPFSYGCPDLDLMGFSEVGSLIHSIRCIHRMRLRDSSYLNSTQKTSHTSELNSENKPYTN